MFGNTRVIAALAVALLPGVSVAASAFLDDSFSGPTVDPKSWYIPTYDHSGDGTYVGRTQFRVTQDSALPAVSRDGACVSLQAYTPQGTAFFGTELITKQAFTVDKGLDITVHAKMTTASRKGIVGGIFLYALKPGSNTLHDEIDFELLTNLPDQVQTNIYGNEPLGIGHVQLIPFRHGGIADDHTYEIKWTANRVSWLIDGEEVRATTSNIPVGAMQFYLNIWAPDSAWPQAFDPSIQPAKAKDSDAVLSALCASAVTIRPLSE
jgi:beta-glucanase (GH16 family)